jgi:hypothetical protein
LDIGALFFAQLERVASPFSFEASVKVPFLRGFGHGYRVFRPQKLRVAATESVDALLGVSGAGNFFQPLGIFFCQACGVATGKSHFTVRKVLGPRSRRNRFHLLRR